MRVGHVAIYLNYAVHNRTELATNYVNSQGIPIESS